MAGRNQIFGQNINFHFLTVYDTIIPCSDARSDVKTTLMKEQNATC